jgi:hypothetical protein
MVAIQVSMRSATSAHRTSSIRSWPDPAMNSARVPAPLTSRKVASPQRQLERCAKPFAAPHLLFPLVVGPVGLEPTTYGLKGRSG